MKEFDYPEGDQNVYASYVGHGGVRWTAGGRRRYSPGTSST